MNYNLVKKPASQDELDLYCFMGEALIKTQIVEQALGHSITMKMHSTVTREKADEIIEKQLRYTLGKAIKIAEAEKLYSSELQEELNSFLDQRNWLVHKAMAESRDDIYIRTSEALFQKIKAVSNKAEQLQHEIELDMANFGASKGRDMSSSFAILNARYKDDEK